MKWLAALLMIVNVAIYLSSGERPGAVEEVIGNDKPNVNKEGMLLLRETQRTALEEKGQEKSASVPILQVESDITDTSSFAEVVNQPSSNTQIAENTGSKNTPYCYRVGPFREDETWSVATRWMEEQGFKYERAASQSRELKAMRVFLGPFKDILSTSDTVNKLKVKKLDHFVYELDNGEVRISLGYFTQQELASKFTKYLGSVGIDAQSVPEYRTLGPYNWLEVVLKGQNSNLLLSQSWLGKGVSVSQVDC